MEGNGASVAVAPGRAWIIGGVLFLASVVVGVRTLPLIALVAWGNILGTVLFSAALVVFAVGIRGAGSVTARKPLGTIALCALAVWTPAIAIVPRVQAVGLSSSGDLLTFGYVTTFVQFVLALIAVVQIGRAAVVPRPWQWTPAWVLAAVAVLWVLEQLIGIGVSTGQTVPAIATVVMTLDGLVRVAASVLFGVLTIVFARRVPQAEGALVAHPARTRRVSS
jgi:hypothetical protein